MRAYNICYSLIANKTLIDIENKTGLLFRALLYIT